MPPCLQVAAVGQLIKEGKVIRREMNFWHWLFLLLMHSPVGQSWVALHGSACHLDASPRCALPAAMQVRHWGLSNETPFGAPLPPLPPLPVPPLLLVHTLCEPLCVTVGAGWRMYIWPRQFLHCQPSSPAALLQACARCVRWRPSWVCLPLCPSRTTFRECQERAGAGCCFCASPCLCACTAVSVAPRLTCYCFRRAALPFPLPSAACWTAGLRATWPRRAHPSTATWACWQVQGGRRAAGCSTASIAVHALHVHAGMGEGKRSGSPAVWMP